MNPSFVRATVETSLFFREKEFVAVMTRKVPMEQTNASIKEAFRVFETPDNPSGHVKTDILVRALMTYGAKPMTETQATELVLQMDQDQRGLVNYSEYVDLMTL
mmetsp:Transcript_9914/g.22129  ORF Transcript_9914/g.22129 Transcript_9914/m.22129 type:complete len:104 (-) Transcript_9914:1082-1393(-)